MACPEHLELVVCHLNQSHPRGVPGLGTALEEFYLSLAHLGIALAVLEAADHCGAQAEDTGYQRELGHLNTRERVNDLHFT